MKQLQSIVLLGVAFEAALGVAGWALAAWGDVPLASRLALSTGGAVRGVVATLPLLAILGYLMQTRWAPLAELRRQVGSLVGEIFADVSLLGLAIVSVAAGVGEELLFRGALQPVAERWWGPAAGLLAVSVLFGFLHAASAAYFLLATAMGLYLGWLAQHFDELTAPIIAHAAYDFAALLALRHAASGGLPGATPDVG